MDGSSFREFAAAEDGRHEEAATEHLPKLVLHPVLEGFAAVDDG